MSVRRILVEKSVHLLGKWDVNKVNDDVVRLIDLDSRERKGRKIRLQLTTDGLQVARAMFQDAQPDDFIPLGTVLNITVGSYNLQNFMCFTRGVSTAYSVTVYSCSNDYDCAEFVDNFRRLRKGTAVDGENFDLRPIDEGNWLLIRPNDPQVQGTMYVQNTRRAPAGQNKVIVVPPHNYESGTLLSSKQAQNKVPLQNGSSNANSDSGIVTNGTSTTMSSVKLRTKPKRAKSFKFFDSLKGNSKREESPRRERKVKHEKFERQERREAKSSENNRNEVNVANGVESVPAAANLSKELQHVNQRIRNIELLLEKGGGTSGHEKGAGQINAADSIVDNTQYVTQQQHHTASDSEVNVVPRMRVSSNDRSASKVNSVNSSGLHKNGEMKEYRIPVGYVLQRPIRVSHVPQTDGVSHHHSHRIRAHSSTDPSHGTEIRLGPTQNVSSSMTLPRNYSHGSPGTKHTPRVTFDDTATEGPSRRNSTRSAGRFPNHGPRATDTVVKPIEKVYANHNVYYGQPRTVVIGPGGRQSSSSVRYSSHDRDYMNDDRRNGVPQNSL